MKTWLITGASSGFGRVMTEKLLAKGDRVAATLRKTDMLNDLKTQYNDQLWVAKLDVTDNSEIKNVLKEAFNELGQIDVIVNNAGYALFGAVEEPTDEQIKQQIDTNILGSVHVIREALPYLRKQGGGRILQLSSMGGQTTYPTLSYYHLTKWAIEGFCETISKEVAPFNIGVTLVEPGAHETSFATSSLVVASVMDEYEKSLVGEVRKSISDGGFPQNGDVNKLVNAMIDSVDQHPAPLRLALGKDAYNDIHDALTNRLVALENQKEIALASDLL